MVHVYYTVDMTIRSVMPTVWVLNGGHVTCHGLVYTIMTYTNGRYVGGGVSKTGRAIKFKNV